MDVSLLMTSSQHLQKVRRVNSTSSSFPSRIPQKAPPTKAEDDDRYTGGTGSATLQEVIRMRGETAAVSQNLLKLIPYALASDTNTFNIRVIAWYAVSPPDNDPNKNIYVPVPLCELACTVSTPSGLAGTQVINTELFCDTITITSGDSSLVKVFSPGNDTIAWAVIDFLGAPWVEVIFDIGTGPTSMNALWKTL